MKCGSANGSWQLATGNLFSVADASEAPRCVRPAHLLSPGRTRCPLAWVMVVFGHVCSLGLRATPGCNRHNRHSPTQGGHGVTLVTLVMVVCRGRNTPAQTHTSRGAVLHVGGAVAGASAPSSVGPSAGSRATAPDASGAWPGAASAAAALTTAPKAVSPSCGACPVATWVPSTAWPGCSGR